MASCSRRTQERLEALEKQMKGLEQDMIAQIAITGRDNHEFVKRTLFRDWTKEFEDGQT